MAKSIGLMCLVVLVGACTDRIVAPEPLTRVPEAGAMLATRCAADPTVTVADEAALLSALASASPGTVIALDGMIPISAGVWITTEDVTLTCTTAGSGLFAPTHIFDGLVLVTASGVTIRGLVLDAWPNAIGPMGAFPAEDGLPVSGVVFTNNVVSCGTDECLFLGSTPNAVVTDNAFTSRSHFIATGLHIQGFFDGPIDGTRVERNTIVATGPSGVDAFGAIRILGGNQIRIANNDIKGPWRNGLALSGVNESTIVGNSVEGALRYGIASTVSFNGIAGVTSSRFGGNRVTRSGIAGIFMSTACFNTFVDNNLLGNPGNVGLIFADPATGGNVYVGSGAIVQDNGGFDCDGDGIIDPNQITGAASVASNAPAMAASVAATVYNGRLR